ncbi:MAG: hypothetical protein WAT39_00525 [Planctomycetota bacterium]
MAETNDPAATPSEPQAASGTLRPVVESNETLPPCVVSSLRAADNLYGVVLTLAFPDLNAPVDTIDAAADRVHEALHWSYQIEDEHRAVMRLFPPRETGVEVTVPRAKLVEVGRHHDARGCPTVYLQPETPKCAAGSVTRRPMRMNVASDVLEPVPARFADSLAAAFPFRGLNGYEPSRTVMSDWIANEWKRDGWPTIRTQLLQARLVVRAKCLGLVGWIREHVAEMRAATHPSIKWKERGKSNGQIVEVTMAGATRPVGLSNSEYLFLTRLAGGTATASRRLKNLLISKLPEIAPYIVSQGAAGKETRYVLPPELRELVRVSQRH